MGGVLSRIGSVASARRFRAESASTYASRFYAGDDMSGSWAASLTAAGVNVTPELAMTLAALYCGVTTIAYDLATCPAQAWKYRDDQGKDRVRARSSDYMKGGIADLAYMLRWAPNDYQTATEFFVGQVAQFLLRGKAYAEIVDGPKGFLAQLLPRHPDRVFPERLPNGQISYKLIEANGQPRYLTQLEMHVVRDLTTDGLNATSRISFGAGVLGSALAAERAAGKFFKSGMTAAVVATYKGALMEDEDEKSLHESISRYASGVDNSFGILLVPDDVTINNLGVEPEKAQMMLAREWGAREVARLLRIPPHKLMIAGTQTYASQVQAATDYLVGCLRPIAHTFEQAIQRDLILAKDTYFVEFFLDALLRGDPAARAAYYTAASGNWMWPSEIRLLENLNPDEELDQLARTAHRPGQAGGQAGGGPKAPDAAQEPPQQTVSGRAALRGQWALFDAATRCVRRERVTVVALAKKHAGPKDVAAWHAALRDFYTEHANYVSTSMRISIPLARGYCAQHGSTFEAQGAALIDGPAGAAWEAYEAEELAALSLEEAAA